jgi:Antibiotic biosynthesis monooxygenase
MASLQVLQQLDVILSAGKVVSTSGPKPDKFCAVRAFYLHLVQTLGFVEFTLITRFFASLTVWENRAVFEAWIKSEAFRAAHSRAVRLSFIVCKSVT